MKKLMVPFLVGVLGASSLGLAQAESKGFGRDPVRVVCKLKNPFGRVLGQSQELFYNWNEASVHIKDVLRIAKRDCKRSFFKAKCRKAKKVCRLVQEGRRGFGRD